MISIIISFIFFIEETNWNITNFYIFTIFTRNYFYIKI